MDIRTDLCSRIADRKSKIENRNEKLNDHTRKLAARARAGRGAMGATMKPEMELIHAHALLMEKFLWLRLHPGKTRRDYQAALRDGSLIAWRIEMTKQDERHEGVAWRRDFPTIDYEAVQSCAADPNEAALFDAWRRGRASMRRARR
jgi:hypothetical protein